MATTYTQDDLDSIDAIIKAKISTGSIGAGSFSMGGVTINQGTSIKELRELYTYIKGILDGEAGNTIVEMGLKGID